MDIKKEYQNQVDLHCNRNCNISGEEMLALVKRNSFKIAGNPNKPKKIKHIKKFMIIAAACISTLGITATVAGAAGYGPLSSLLRDVFNDDTTAELIDEGYLYNVDMSAHDGIFKVDFLATTGDEETPKLIFDIYVNDTVLVENNDTIDVTSYVLGANEYKNNKDEYCPCISTAQKDADIPNLYHLIITETPAWITSGETFVACISEITTDTSSDTPKIYNTNIAFELTTPAESYRDITYEYYDNLAFNRQGINYVINQTTFGMYKTSIDFYYSLSGSDITGDSKDYYKYENELHENWTALANDIIINVDGVEYKVNQDGIGESWFDENSDKYSPDCYTHLTFPAVNYDDASKITISAGDICYTLKDTENQTDNGSRYECYSYVIFEQSGIKYHLSLATYNNIYKTTLTFAYSFLGSDITGDSDDYYKYEKELHENWLAVANNMVLTVDGVEYRVDKNDPGYTLYSADLTDTEYPCFVHPTFLPFDYDSAQNITLSVGDVSYTLK
ncbi:MAG: hypothetical protein IJP18_04845 [Oscillospiraceae bacterium]|nr:hypothetical protein [Oscillospiraceae bacterium]